MSRTVFVLGFYSIPQVVLKGLASPWRLFKLGSQLFSQENISSRTPVHSDNSHHQLQIQGHCSSCRSACRRARSYAKTCRVANWFMHPWFVVVDTKIMTQKKCLYFSLKGRMCSVRNVGLTRGLCPLLVYHFGQVITLPPCWSTTWNLTVHSVVAKVK